MRASAGQDRHNGAHGALSKKDLRAAEALCRERLRMLESWIHLEDVADVQALCAMISAHTGRPIYLEAWLLTTDVAGFWLAGSGTDYIFYAANATPPHQEHIILHELAHVLSGHSQEPIDVQALHDIYFPHLDHDVVHMALSRTCYDSKTEREAELLASLIEQRWRTARLAIEPSSAGNDASNGSDNAESIDVQQVRERLDDFAAKLRDD